MKKIILILTILAVVLAGCASEPAAVTEGPTEPAVSEEQTQPAQEPQAEAPQPGYFVASSVGRDGNITFYTAPDPANGWIRLEADHTGVLFWDGTEQDLTWDDEAIYPGDETIPCVYTSYYDPELEADDTMLALYFLDSQTSVIFRPVEETAGV